jgi:quinol monooxygenase YgiN
MYARHVTLQLKKNMVTEFPTVFEKEILPMLRKQKGFLDELLLVTPEKLDVIAISLWEEKEHAETYNREIYPQVVKILQKFIEGTPMVKPLDVRYSTFHKLAIPVGA